LQRFGSTPWASIASNSPSGVKRLISGETNRMLSPKLLERQKCRRSDRSSGKHTERQRECAQFQADSHGIVLFR
jgi:hypothetical protein